MGTTRTQKKTYMIPLSGEIGFYEIPLNRSTKEMTSETEFARSLFFIRILLALALGRISLEAWRFRALPICPKPPTWSHFGKRQKGKDF